MAATRPSQRLSSSLLIAAALLLVPSILFAQAAPRMVRLSFSGSDPRFHMGVTWHSDSAAEQYVQYGVAGVGENQLAAVATSPLGGGLGVVHSVDVAGLQPDTTYSYRVGSTADGWTPATGSYSFTTAPDDPCAPFTFAALGDPRGDAYLDFMNDSGSEWTNVFEQVMQDDPEFILVAGDLVDDGTQLDQWNDFLNQNPGGGDPAYPYVPLMPSFGNHDDGGAGGHNYEDLYTLPQNDVGDERYYHFVYGNTLFIAFNTEEDGPSRTWGEQVAWLEQVLIDNPATWKFIFFHHPVWTTTPGETDFGCLICGHPPDENGQNVYLVDLFDRYDVDVVFQSHNHFYERSEPMRGGGSHDTMLETAPSYRGTTVGTRDGNGVVPTWGSLHVLSGGGGAPLIPISTLASLGQVWVPGQVSRNDEFHHVKFVVDDLVLSMQAIEAGTGAVLDSLVITKLNEYRVGACTLPPPVDNDNDGFFSDVDCNDANGDIYPGAPEICGDGIDQNCDTADTPCPPQDGGPSSDGAPTTGDGTVSGGDAATGGGDPDGCGCRGGSGSVAWLGLLPLLVVRRRRRSR